MNDATPLEPDQLTTPLEPDQHTTPLEPDQHTTPLEPDQLSTQDLTTRIFDRIASEYLPTGTSAILILLQDSGPGLACGIGSNLPPHILRPAIASVAQRIKDGGLRVVSEPTGDAS